MQFFAKGQKVGKLTYKANLFAEIDLAEIELKPYSGPRREEPKKRLKEPAAVAPPGVRTVRVPVEIRAVRHDHYLVFRNPRTGEDEERFDKSTYASEAVKEKAFAEAAAPATPDLRKTDESRLPPMPEDGVVTRKHLRRVKPWEIREFRLRSRDYRSQPYAYGLDVS